MRLSVETFDGRTYLRIRCMHGRDEKVGMRKLQELLFDGVGQLRLRDGVLYL